MTGILVASEQPALLAELLTPALALGGPVVALDPLGRADADDLVARGADRVLRRHGTPPDAEVVAALLDAAIDAAEPELLLVGSTVLGAEAVARLCQRRGLPFVNEAEELVRTADGLRAHRRCMGRFVATEEVGGSLAVATVRARLFTPPDRGLRSGEVTELDPPLPAPRVRILGSQPRPRCDEAVEEADRVVSVGRGLRGPEDLPIVRGLAGSLDAAVGGSRPVTEHLGWLPLDLKVGLSGKTIAPELYVACGISGQIEHIVGMRDSRVVVAINSDPAAPIFEEADFYVVGDLYEVVPALQRAIEEVRAAR